MSKKVKLISIILVTILMLVGLTFGPKNQEYFIDFNFNKLYSKVNNAVTLAVDNKNKDSYELQEDILAARELVDEFKDYIVANNKEGDYSSQIVAWSVKLDSAQQIILTRVTNSINKAKEVKSSDTINEARSSIPSNMPSKWKDGFEKNIDSIKPNN
ncbi:hypothetical protein LGK99_09425 [Clostridium algidicarnis]|uniref:hypothetical protein n=1 Tax=Clostridium algidicarnis TaxID=37659 RepID=UPI001CF0FC9E|nr:hypothetical protein [Clostridium algidicarnis]MCB2287309.1 hypothetical protein [Clostridium algidicarnis]